MVVSTRNVSRSAPTMAAPLPFAAAQTMAAPTMAAPTMMAAPAMATPFGYGYNPMAAGFMQQQAMMAPIMMMPPQAPTAASLAAAGLTQAQIDAVFALEESSTDEEWFLLAFLMLSTLVYVCGLVYSIETSFLATHALGISSFAASGTPLSWNHPFC